LKVNDIDVCGICGDSIEDRHVKVTMTQDIADILDADAVESHFYCYHKIMKNSC